eukprot:gnl/MRDRNA2_/MRDRNA2_52416_c0_seq1.p1 gnl/MRDRNA2_/MRDRNA2_52416_c0~~gnl/MRDRNA2_/MRDRNA2_52416_c0_seq1.p1  ORF type:complete len:354 (+),score=60.17 gnl/MRDRNA2_/MRDRNA2_52416_c0_seq1:119-1180(+)
MSKHLKACIIVVVNLLALHANESLASDAVKVRDSVNKVRGSVNKVVETLVDKLLDQVLKIPRSHFHRTDMTLEKAGHFAICPMTTSVERRMERSVAPLGRSENFLGWSATCQCVMTETRKDRAAGTEPLGRRTFTALGAFASAFIWKGVPACWAANEDVMLASSPQQKGETFVEVKERLRLARSQLGRVERLANEGEFVAAQKQLQSEALKSLREDVTLAGFLLKNERPDFDRFEAAEVFGSLQVTDFALRGAGIRKNSLENKIGLPDSMTRPDDVFFNLKRLQDGIDNVVQALECRCPRDSKFTERLNQTFSEQVQAARSNYVRKTRADDDMRQNIENGQNTVRRRIAAFPD